MKTSLSFGALRRRSAAWRQSGREILRLVVDPKLSRSYFPSEKRKSKLQIFVDLLVWFFRYGEVNTFYYVYGFDRESGVDFSHYMPYCNFRRIRDSQNLKSKGGHRYNYVCILRDKLVFSQFASSLNFPTPKTIATCDQESITWLDGLNTVPLSTLFPASERRFSGFCKPVTGMRGKGAFPLRLENRKLFIGDDEVTLDQLRSRLDGQYLIQERIQQHPNMGSLHLSSINTIRLITFNSGGNVVIFSAALRVGTAGRSVDNWAAGGIVLGIDLGSGRLRTDGLYKPGYGGRVQQHPQTQVIFSGFEVPYFGEAVALARKFHTFLGGIHSIGWDIAVTEAGPVIVEGNDDWDGAIPMALESNFKERFLAMYPPLAS